MTDFQPTILIVDDEPDLLDAIAFDFRRNNYNVLTASCGNDAIRILDSEKVDLVLSDVKMPNGDGIELLEKIKSKNVRTPAVIFVSGFADIRLEDAYDKGIEAFFTKPFNRKALLEAVNSSIQTSRKWNNRRMVRVDTELMVKARFLKSGIAIEKSLTNIGRGGIFMPTFDKHASVGEEVEFSIHSNSDLNFKVEGKGIVRWLRTEIEDGQPIGCGIEFLDLNEGAKDNILDLINFVKTKAYIPKM